MDLEFDFPGFSIGVAEDEQRTTGCTVFVFERGNRMAADVRGGAPGLTDVDHAGVSAICLAGGSLTPRRRCVGSLVARPRREQRAPGSGPAGLRSSRRRRAACGRREPPDSQSPNRALRRCARGAAPLTSGRRSAHAPPGGLRSRTPAQPVGTAERSEADGGAWAGAGRSSHCAAEAVVIELIGGLVIVTRLGLGRRELVQWGRQVHTSMARAIHPFHTITDGDVLFSVSTMAVDRPIATEVLGMEASDAMWDAVLAAVTPA